MLTITLRVELHKPTKVKLGGMDDDTAPNLGVVQNRKG
ncbi:hypothetical protein BJQ97_02808 [Geobacillus sp. TFV-3]|nr:hypothetical protein BJQ97_02808 [Geobacillus sp. TFV-3]